MTYQSNFYLSTRPPQGWREAVIGPFFGREGVISKKNGREGVIEKIGRDA